MSGGLKIKYTHTKEYKTPKQLRNLEMPTLSIERLNMESEQNQQHSLRDNSKLNNTFTKKFALIRKTLCGLNSLYWWPLVEVHVFSSNNFLSWHLNSTT